MDAREAEIAGDTIGGALAVSRQLPVELGEALLTVAQNGFAEALHANALIGAAIMAATALLTATCLSEVKLDSGGH